MRRRMVGLRWWLAKWLLGSPFFLLSEDDEHAWLVTRRGGTTVGLRVTEWHGDWQTLWTLPDITSTTLYQVRTSHKGTFGGKFG